LNTGADQTVKLVYVYFILSAIFHSVEGRLRSKRQLMYLINKGTDTLFPTRSLKEIFFFYAMTEKTVLYYSMLFHYLFSIVKDRSLLLCFCQKLFKKLITSIHITVTYQNFPIMILVEE
jgi:hypothetical protein